jgi:hypothetical protein
MTLYEKETLCPSGYTNAKYGILEIKNVKYYCGKNYNINNEIIEKYLPYKINIEIPLLKDLEDEFEININFEDHILSDRTIFSENNLYEEIENYKIENEFFKFSLVGGDIWYPNGYVKVNMEKFQEIKSIRHNDKRKVWIFYGESGTGKSYLSSKLNIKKYETDMSEKLPKIIYDDIIILGNKYKYKIDDIIKKIYDRKNSEIIMINFNKAI